MRANNKWQSTQFRKIKLWVFFLYFILFCAVYLGLGRETNIVMESKETVQMCLCISNFVLGVELPWVQLHNDK